MKKHPFLISIFLLPFLFASSLHSAKIPHQGRVLVEGKPFDGEGQFWFALVTQDGGFAWNHEGWGGFPTSPLTVSVRGGFYKVVLGDTSITGMSTLPDQLLAANDDLELAIWFSDGVNGIARLGENQPLSKSTYSIVSDHLRNTQLMNALSERLDFLENENNQSISDALNQMSSRIEEIDTAQLISSLEIIDSNLSDIYQRIDSMDDNSTVSGFSPEALAKITALEEQLEKALNRIDSLETTQSSGGIDPRILAQVGYRQLPDANLSGVNLTSVVLEDANFSGADLEGAKLKNTNFRNADFIQSKS